MTHSFAVGSQYGPRSGVWMVTVDARKDPRGPDVYVAGWKYRKSWKVTLHASGRWHLKDIRDANSTEPAPPPLIKLNQNDTPPGRYPIGVSIVIPDSCLRPASLAEPPHTTLPDQWLERPTEGGVVQVAVMVWNHLTHPGEEWPGRAAGTQPLRFMRVSEDQTLMLLGRWVDRTDPEAIQINDEIQRWRRQFDIDALDSRERRGFIAGATETGTIGILEVAID